MSDFQSIFHAAPEVKAAAPGRVNLLGEHTDYNDGFVLPTAILQQTIVQLGHCADRAFHFYSHELKEQVTWQPSESIPTGFARYLVGCTQLLEETGISVPPLNIFVASDVPIGSGLSSSAALEVAMLRGLRSLLNLKLDDVQIAQLAQQAEIHYAGVQCGIMDQMASSLADPVHMLFLDTRSLDRQILDLPERSEILVIDSGIPRTLAGSGYNQRRAECEEAAKQLGVKALRDIEDLEVIKSLPEPLRRRARHVVTENNRVLEAKQGVAATRFGELMNDSHISLRDDYEVSVPGLDQLVAILQQMPGVFGARLTGAGFGGACVALVQLGQAEAIAHQALEKYQQQGFQGKLLVPEGDREG